MARKMSAAALEEQRKYKREYMKRWRAAHPDRVKAINARYWEKRAAKSEEDEAEGDD